MIRGLMQVKKCRDLGISVQTISKYCVNKVINLEAFKKIKYER